MEANNKENNEMMELGFKGVILRAFAFLGDIIIPLSPVYIWVLLFLLVMANKMGMGAMTTWMHILKFLMVALALLGNVFIALATDGASFGKLILGLRVVNKNNTKCTKRAIFIREFFGKSLWLAIFIFMGSVKLILLMALIMGVVVIVSRGHLNIIDFVTDTKVVAADQVLNKAVVRKTSETAKVKKIAKYNNIDMNVKSNFSIDGTYSVEELMKMARDNGVKTLSICDKNNFKANIMAQKIAPLYGINYINGISVDCEYQGNDVELLIYGADNDDELCKKLEYEFLLREKELTEQKINKLSDELNIVIDLDKMLAKYRYPILTDEMIADELLNNPIYADESFVKKYLKGPKSDDPINNFVKDYLAMGAPCYIEATNPDIELVIKYFSQKDVKLVLAHPLVSLMYNPKCIEEIIDLGLDGIEVYSPGHDKDDIEHLLALAERKHIGVSGGSYKKNNKKRIKVGAYVCDRKGEELINNFAKTCNMAEIKEETEMN